MVSPRPTPSSSVWKHKPTTTTLVWLVLSTTIVWYDLSYMLWRPATLPGGVLYFLYPLYVDYGNIDWTYSAAAWEARYGFGGAQSILNLVENLIYHYYYYLLLTNGKKAVTGVEIAGRKGGLAVMLLLVAATMTWSKTVLYWFVEYYSDFSGIRHNNMRDLILCWMVPNGLWIIFPFYVMYVTGKEIVDGLANATTAPTEKKTA